MPLHISDFNSVQEAIDAAEAAGGGEVVFGPSPYPFAAPLTVDVTNVWLRGAGDGPGGTYLYYTGVPTDQTLIDFRGVQHGRASDLYLTSVTKLTGGAAIRIGHNGINGAFACQVENVRADYVYDLVKVEGAAVTKLKNVHGRNLLGLSGIDYAGTAAFPNHEVTIDLIGDNPYPHGYGALRTWAPSTLFALGDIVAVNGMILNCSQGGLSGAAAPSGIPGTTSQTAFTTEIVDGAARWKFVAQSFHSWIRQGSYAHTCIVQKAACLNGGTGFQMQDAANTGSSYPMFAFLDGLACDHSFYNGMNLVAGEGVWAKAPWLGSMLSANGFSIGAAHRGEITYLGGRVMGCRQNGGVIAAGPKNIKLLGMDIGDNSQQGSGLFHGVAVGADQIGGVQIIGGKIGDLVGAAGNPQGYGIFAGNGVQNLQVDNVDLRGNATGPILAGTISNCRFTNNPGYNPVGASAVTVGASPFTYTAGATPETIYIRGGTVSDIKHGGVTVYTATEKTLSLGPNEAAQITYSAAPTVVRHAH